AHVDDTFEAEMRGDGCRSDTVLARAGFRDDARLAHAHGEESLADGVIDFVRAGVQQVFALKIYTRAAEMRSQTRCELQRRWPASEIPEQILEARLKRCVGLRLFVGVLQLEERHHECFRHIAAAVGTEAARRGRRRLKNGAHKALDFSVCGSSC